MLSLHYDLIKHLNRANPYSLPSHYAVPFDELSGRLVRGRRGVWFNGAQYFVVRQQKDSIIWRCGAVALGRRCRLILTTTLTPELRVTNESYHSFSFCPSLSTSPTESSSFSHTPTKVVATSSSNDNRSLKRPATSVCNHAASKRWRLAEENKVTTYTTQRDARVLRYNGASFKFTSKRKTDNVLVWRCCRCGGGLETTELMTLLKLPNHKNICLHQGDVRRPHPHKYQTYCILLLIDNTFSKLPLQTNIHLERQFSYIVEWPLDLIKRHREQIWIYTTCEIIKDQRP